MRLCKDCKHYVIDKRGECHSPKNDAGYRSMETGEYILGWRHNKAEYARRGGRIDAWMENACGIRARWFEPKEPEPK